VDGAESHASCACRLIDDLLEGQQWLCVDGFFVVSGICTMSEAGAVGNDHGGAT
jgi:hypothetical protein